jgi:hypothetical protein
VRLLDPALERRTLELGLMATRDPTGDEDVLCLVIGAHSGEAVNELEGALQRFEQEPFALLILHPSASGSAISRASGLLSSRWLIRVDGSSEDVVLLAPHERLLNARVLPGQWQAAPLASDGPASDQDALALLWSAVERDRQSLTSLVERLGAGARDLEETRGARERLSGEVARLRAAERREADRVRLEALEDRIWVAEQVRRLAESMSWRIGHRLVRTVRRLTFRRDRGTNLPARIIDRMQEPR